MLDNIVLLVKKENHEPDLMLMNEFTFKNTLRNLDNFESFKFNDNMNAETTFEVTTFIGKIITPEREINIIIDANKNDSKRSTPVKNIKGIMYSEEITGNTSD